MKIQEMKFGVSHLSKKTEVRERENVLEISQIKDTGEESQTADEILCELEKPFWSVVSFDRKIGSGLTYAEATQLMSELDLKKIAGLCIITDMASARLK